MRATHLGQLITIASMIFILTGCLGVLLWREYDARGGRERFPFGREGMPKDGLIYWLDITDKGAVMRDKDGYRIDHQAIAPHTIERSSDGSYYLQFNGGIEKP